MPAEGVRIEGLAELNRAFRQLSTDSARELRGELLKAAEPVRAAAQTLAGQRITNIGPVWSGMKAGATSRYVYVSPKARRRGGSPRPNLGGLLMKRAMQPALAKEAPTVEGRLERLFNRLADRHGF